MTYTNVLKKMILLTLTCITFNLSFAQVAFAAEDAATTTQTTTETETKTENKVVTKNDQTRINRLAELSGKTKEEILKMRTEQHMGWGEIAKALGVPPSELGQSIRKDRKEKNADRKLEKNERREHDEKKSEHKADK